MKTKHSVDIEENSLSFTQYLPFDQSFHFMLKTDLKWELTVIDSCVSPVPGGMSITRISSSPQATCRKSFSTADMTYNLHISKEKLLLIPLIEHHWTKKRMTCFTRTKCMQMQTNFSLVFIRIFHSQVRQVTCENLHFH